VKSKKILVIIIMVVLVSSVVAGSASLFNRSPNNNDVAALNAKISGAVSSCMQSLPAGTPQCDMQLGSVIERICSPQNTNEQQRSQIDACHDGKVLQYYQIRNAQITKSGNTTSGNNNTTQR
jgi:flagellar basal body-associated protein FliL